MKINGAMKIFYINIFIALVILDSTDIHASDLIETNAVNSTSPSNESRMAYLESFTNETDVVNAYNAKSISKMEFVWALSNQVANLHFTDMAQVRTAYRSGLIGREEAMIAQVQLGNEKTQNFYGKVINQTGQPVAGVNVVGNLELRNGLYVGKTEKCTTQTDVNGLFQFVGLKGFQLGVDIAKDGHEIKYGIGESGPPGNQSSPTDRRVFTMWQRKGPEPMVHSKIHAYIPCDGNVVIFDLLTGKKDLHGDLIVSLTRKPVDINRGKPFNWALTLKIPDGGIEEATNIYLNEAPLEGYQSEVNLDFKTNALAW